MEVGVYIASHWIKKLRYQITLNWKRKQNIRYNSISKSLGICWPLYYCSWACTRLGDSPIAVAVSWASPVTILILTPLCNSVWMDSRTKGRGGSQIPTRPMYTRSWRLLPLAIPTTATTTVYAWDHLCAIYCYCTKFHTSLQMITPLFCPQQSWENYFQL